MSTPNRQAPLQTSYPIDPENVHEMNRLTNQARLMTRTTGLLPPQVSLTAGQTVLDIGCGPGEWVLEVARQHPDCQVVGLDISQRMVTYASSCAQVQHLPNARFEVANACEPLPFPHNSWDFIHARFVTGFLSTTTWPIFLKECFRVLRPDGILCNTELENMGDTNSAALTRYNALIVQSMRLGQRCFTESGNRIGITSQQTSLLRQSGLSPVYQQPHVLNYSAETPAHLPMVEDFAALMQLIQPVLLRENLIEQEELSLLYLEAMGQMHASDFYAVMFLQTAWGIKPA
jgi:ubiquinone/menaquinone biosynthesis C-methylase UbiE